MGVEVILGFTAGIAVVAFGFYLIFRNSSKRKAKRLNEASARLVKEKYLNKLISGEQNRALTGQKKLLIKLSWNEHGKQEFVVDPSEEICFGRDEKNQVVVNYEKVSSVHCRILLNRGNLYLQDMNSLNGTFLLRNGKVYRVWNMTALLNGDVIQIGDVQFTVNPFYFDMRGI
ncbi:MAG: FHA domain-containing protein [Erysipelotrichaceae bacterium]|nr:FHA domain-containing protein [Erysipelotrichaceae bacterium]